MGGGSSFRHPGIFRFFLFLFFLFFIYTETTEIPPIRARLDARGRPLIEYRTVKSATRPAQGALAWHEDIPGVCTRTPSATRKTKTRGNGRCYRPLAPRAVSPPWSVLAEVRREKFNSNHTLRPEASRNVPRHFVAKEIGFCELVCSASFRLR